MIKYNGVKVVIVSREWDYITHSNNYIIRVDDENHEMYNREFIINDKEIGWEDM